MRQSSSDTNCECEKRFVSQVSSCQPQHNFTSSRGCSQAKVLHTTARLLRHLRRSLTRLPCDSPAQPPTANVRNGSYLKSLPVSPSPTSQAAQAKVLHTTARLLRHLRRSLTRLPCDSPARTPTANVRNGSYLKSLPVSPSTTSQAAEAVHRPRSSKRLLGCSDI